MLKRSLGLLVNHLDHLKTQLPAFLPGFGVKGSIFSGDENARSFSVLQQPPRPFGSAVPSWKPYLHNVTAYKCSMACIYLLLWFFSRILKVIYVHFRQFRKYRK